jgi:hypothetical protein
MNFENFLMVCLGGMASKYVDKMFFFFISKYQINKSDKYCMILKLLE